MAKKSISLLSKLFAFWDSHVDKEEYQFYQRLIKAACDNEERALELFCGSGRLLLPYVKEGLDVHGIEGSIDLVTKLHEKASKEKLKVSVKQMNMSDCEIKGEFGCIYITMGSFLLIQDREDARLLLEKCYQSLINEGVLSIALFLPYGGEEFISNSWVIASDYKDKESKHRYIRREKSTLDIMEQIITGKVRYETWLGRDLLEMEEKDLDLRWYGKYEFISFLEEIGFRDIEVKRSYNEEDTYKESFMIFIARK